jgi:uncharacterized protein (TIGR00369 family)
MTLMTPEALNAFFDREFPQLTHAGERSILVESVGVMVATVRLVHHDRHLRPGGTISGPAMFALADVALYATILAQIGPIGLAVTTNMTINFMRKPLPGDLVARCRLMKLGRQLAVGEATLVSEGSEDIVAHATGTYAIPPAAVVA